MASPVRVERAPNAVRVTIDRPEVRNALNLEALQSLVAALDETRRAPEPVVILTGAGEAFCAGGDVQDMVARRGQAFATYERLRAGLLAIVERIMRHPKPVVARIAGDAVGAGCAIALACDVAVASDRARFGFPFVKVGLVPDTGASWLLPRAVGLPAARRLLLSGELIDAATAERWGLIVQRVPDAAALDAAIGDWTRRLAELPPGAIGDTKRLLAGNLDVPLATAMQQEALLQAVRFTTDEHARAVDAFLSKRKGGA